MNLDGSLMWLFGAILIFFLGALTHPCSGAEGYTFAWDKMDWIRHRISIGCLLLGAILFVVGVATFIVSRV